jgi:hypothetical protein
MALMTTFIVGAGEPTSAASATVYPKAGTFSHVCNVIGTDGVTEAVHCADLGVVWVKDSSLGLDGAIIQAEGETVCQPAGGGAPKPCAGIIQNTGLYDKPGDGPYSIYRQACGYWGDAPCPSSARYYGNTGPDDAYVARPPAGKCVAVNYWAALTSDWVMLPSSGSGTIVTGGSATNVASKHLLKVCA